MNIREHQTRQDDKAATLAEALGDFFDAHAEFRAAMTSWNQSNAEEGSARWKKLEAEADTAARPRQDAARALLGVLERFAGIEYDVVVQGG